MVRESDRDDLEWLIFGGGGGRRYTQSSPVLPDVWIAYGGRPGRAQELLLEPHRDALPGKVAVELRRGLGLPEDGSVEQGHDLIYTQASVAVRLSLAELVRAVLPMTSWWVQYVYGSDESEARGTGLSKFERWAELREDRSTLEARLGRAIEELEETFTLRVRRLPADRRSESSGGGIPADVVWMTWIVGWLAWKEALLDSSPSGGEWTLRDWHRALRDLRAQDPTFPRTETEDTEQARRRMLITSLSATLDRLDSSARETRGQAGDLRREIGTRIRSLIRVSRRRSAAEERRDLDELIGVLESFLAHLEEGEPVLELDRIADLRDGIEALRALDEPLGGEPPSSASRRSTIVKHALDLLAGVNGGDSDSEWCLPAPPSDAETRIWQVNRNRGAHLAVQASRLAIKADAAWSLFDVSCSKLAWAVIDSGIDASHLAFRRPNPADARNPHPQAFEGKTNRTRIEATYDFTRVRLLLNPALLGFLQPETTEAERGARPGPLPAKLAKSIDDLAIGETQRDILRERVAALRNLLGQLDREWEERGSPGEAPPLRAQLGDLGNRLQSGAQVDWDLLEPFLRVAHDASYWVPASDHGTHVAAILGGDWERGKGICPDIRLYDLRVLPSGLPGDDDELNVIAALQFVRHLNSMSTDVRIHGVNLSLSIPHEVASFACGRTPVCDECDRVTASGVVVVAAAGNNGWQRFNTSKGLLDGYHTISITDPGNADSVITVGSTHRNKPHTYGVSYFSSRGPTGDGRIKPDLVAPGEKIVAAVPGDAVKEMDGTSMAAPHVSGAAAILMARHRELIGQAARIKNILCETATDLGRERYFQGHGMLDVLRALQSV